MELDVLLFAGLREAVGRERVRLDLPEGARVADLLERLGSVHAALRTGATPRFAVAVNLEVVRADRVLAAGDEVALLPPVGGGSTDGSTDARDLILLGDAPIDVARLLAFVGDPGAGGVALFLGTARDVHEGQAVLRLEYEAYPAMARKVLEEIALETRARVPDLKRIAIAHRLGVVPIGEASVAVAVSSPHRAEAFAACRHAIDAVKARAPIWKKEQLAAGVERWVENKQPGEQPGT